MPEKHKCLVCPCCKNCPCWCSVVDETGETIKCAVKERKKKKDKKDKEKAK